MIVLRVFLISLITLLGVFLELDSGLFFARLLLVALVLLVWFAPDLSRLIARRKAPISAEEKQRLIAKYHAPQSATLGYFGIAVTFYMFALVEIWFPSTSEFSRPTDFFYILHTNLGSHGVSAFWAILATLIGGLAWLKKK